jgi:hypothetical protein
MHAVLYRPCLHAPIRSASVSALLLKGSSSSTLVKLRSNSSLIQLGSCGGASGEQQDVHMAATRHTCKPIGEVLRVCRLHSSSGGISYVTVYGCWRGGGNWKETTTLPSPVIGAAAAALLFSIGASHGSDPNGTTACTSHSQAACCRGFIRCCCCCCCWCPQSMGDTSGRPAVEPYPSNTATCVCVCTHHCKNHSPAACCRFFICCCWCL